MAGPQSDEEAAEAVKRWWREYGTSVIAGLAIGLIGLFGWRAWVDYQEQHARDASVRYAQLVQVLDQGPGSEAVADAASAMFNRYSDTPYAALAAFQLAESLIEAGQLDKARERLDWAAKNNEVPGLAHVARLRLARVWFEQGEPQKALALLADRNAKAFSPLYEELRGDIYRSLDDLPEARSAYRAALDGLPDEAGNRYLIQLKLNDLPGGDRPDEESPS